MITCKTIPLASPDGASLKVTRNDDAPRLTLSICLGRSICASVSLDARGWDDLSNCVALPPALPPASGAVLKLTPLARREKSGGSA